MFYSYEQLFYSNTGNGACSTVAQLTSVNCPGTAGYFKNDQNSATHTFGIAGEWKVTSKLKLKGEYNFSYGSVMFTQFNGVFLGTATQTYQNVGNYPDINSTMHSVQLTAIYELTPTIDLGLRGMFSAFHNNDWADNLSSVQTYYSAAPPSVTTSTILSPGYGQPNWSVVALMAGARFKF